MTIAITGSMAFDHIMSFSGNFTDYIVPDQLEHLSVSFLVDSMRRERGGVAGNIAYTLALLGNPSLLMVAVGPDAKEYIMALEAQGIDTSAVLFTQDLLTASFFVSTDRHNRQIANFYIGAMGKSSEISFHTYKDRNISLAIISPNTPDAMVKYVTECKALGIPYVYDPSQQIPLFSREELIDGIDGAHLLIANDYELELIKEKTILTLPDIRTMAEVVIITRGEGGSSIYLDGEEAHIPAIQGVNVADPTGAGDAYRAGILAARRRHLDWLEVGRIGTLAATYALEEYGTQKHFFTVGQFVQRYFQNFERTVGVEAYFGTITEPSQ